MTATRALYPTIALSRPLPFACVLCSAQRSHNSPLVRRAASALLLGVASAYQSLVSPLIGRNCRFVPSCSDYLREAVTIFGPYRGALLFGWRIARCNPAGGSGYDPPSYVHLFQPISWVPQFFSNRFLNRSFSTSCFRNILSLTLFTTLYCLPFAPFLGGRLCRFERGLDRLKTRRLTIMTRRFFHSLRHGDDLRQLRRKLKRTSVVSLISAKRAAITSVLKTLRVFNTEAQAV